MTFRCPRGHWKRLVCCWYCIPPGLSHGWWHWLAQSPVWTCNKSMYKMLYRVQCSTLFVLSCSPISHQKELFHCNNFAPTKHLQVLLSGDCMIHDKRDIVRNVPWYLLPGDFFPAFIFALPFARTGAQRWQFGSKVGITLRHVECITETERFLRFIAKSQTLVAEGNSGDKIYIYKQTSILNSYFYSTRIEKKS